MSTIDYNNPFSNPPQSVPPSPPSPNQNPDAPGGSGGTTVAVPGAYSTSTEQTTVQLQIGSIPPIPPLSQSPGQGINTVCEFFTTYHWWSGYEPQPVAGPALTPCEMIGISAPTCMKRVLWVVQSIGAMPAIPNPNTGSDNEVLIYKQLASVNPTKLPDGTLSYTMMGAYYYALQVPPSGTDQLALGSDVNPADGVYMWLPATLMANMLGPVPSVTGQGAGVASPTNPSTPLGAIMM